MLEKEIDGEEYIVRMKMVATDHSAASHKLLYSRCWRNSVRVPNTNANAVTLTKDIRNQNANASKVKKGEHLNPNGHISQKLPIDLYTQYN
jgi:hypothetical protein